MKSLFREKSSLVLMCNYIQHPLYPFQNQAIIFFHQLKCWVRRLAWCIFPVLQARLPDQF